jgi:hypothetical protein
MQIARRPSPWKTNAVKGCIYAWKGSVVSKIRLFGLIVIVLQVIYFAEAQNASPPESNACGDNHSAFFKLHTDKKLHPVGSASPHEALIYVIQEGNLWTRFGVDGNWIGGNSKSSYFFSSVSAGDHHLCAEAQQGGFGIHVKHPPLGVIGLSAKDGEVYYFRILAKGISGVAGVTTKGDLVMNGLGTQVVDIERIDPDRGKLLVSRLGFSTWK